jgi:alkaline phosphatase D
MRGADLGDVRTIGVAALFEGRRYVGGSARYFRLHREYDRTGCTDFEGLKAETIYTVRMGSLSLDSTDALLLVSDEDVVARLPNPSTWRQDLRALPAEESEAVFRTPADSDGDGLSFIFGSCRYPGLFWGKEKRADAVFGPIYDRFQNPEDGKCPAFFLMVGDQIYADMLNRLVPIARADTPEEFRDRYLKAFGSRNMRRLLRSVPTYMILDDHEIEDNWVRGRLDRSDKRLLFNYAISAYMSYQWLHGPRNFDKRLYYNFTCQGFPFFVLDERTQRIRDDDDRNLEDNHLLGYPAKNPDYKGQIDHLCDWLRDQQDRIGNRLKFIVSPTVFVPNPVASINDNKKWKSDSWPAFPITRRQLLRTIVDHNVHNVVFLSGDIHCSNVAAMTFHHDQDGELPLKAFSITSSAFYWPFPFADGDPLDYVHDSHAEHDSHAKNDDFDIIEGQVSMRYRSWSFEQDDNFTQVDIEADRIIVRTFNKKGQLLTRAVLDID